MLLLIASHLRYLIKYLVVFMTVIHTCFYIVVDTKRGCRTLKLYSFVLDDFLRMAPWCGNMKEINTFHQLYFINAVFG
jgi:hypothetical protein